MKKILTAFLILSAALPFATFAACQPRDFQCEKREALGGQQVNGDQFFRSDEEQARRDRIQARQQTQSTAGSAQSPPGGANSDGFSTIQGTNPEGFGETVFTLGEKNEHLTDSAAMLGCESAGSFGGAMSGALGNALNGLLDSVVGQATGKLNEFLGTIASKAGPLAPFVNKVIDKIMPEIEKVGNQIANSVAGGISDALGLGSDPISGIAKAVGLDPSAVTNFLGLGAALPIPFPIPGISGGVGIPVDVIGKHVQLQQGIKDYSVKIEGRLDIIEQIERNDIYVTCVLNPTTAKTKNELMKQKVAAMLEYQASDFDEDPIFPQNLAEYIHEDIEFKFKKLIEDRTAGMCSSFKQDVQRIATTQWTYDNNYGKKVQCGTSPTGEQPGVGVPTVASWWSDVMDFSRDPFYAVLATHDEGNRIKAESALVGLTEYTKNEGYYNKCRVDRDAGVGKYCLNGQIVTHGSVIKESIDNTLNIPNEQLIAADEIGELIDSLMQGLEQFAFQNLEGLLGLAGEEAGSYVDALVGDTAQDTTDSLQGILSTDISGALETERAYNEMLGLVIADLETARASYTEVRACYQPLTVSGTPTIPVATARAVVDLASTTITTAITPQLNELYIERANSDTSIEELSNLLDAAESAYTLEDSLVISNSYTALKESGLTHNATDLEYLVSGLQASAVVIEALLQDARLKLAACKGT